jgi:hypothetical protein
MACNVTAQQICSTNHISAIQINVKGFGWKGKEKGCKLLYRYLLALPVSALGVQCHKKKIIKALELWKLEGRVERDREWQHGVFMIQTKKGWAGAETPAVTVSNWHSCIISLILPYIMVMTSSCRLLNIHEVWLVFCSVNVDWATCSFLCKEPGTRIYPRWRTNSAQKNNCRWYCDWYFVILNKKISILDDTHQGRFRFYLVCNFWGYWTMQWLYLSNYRRQYRNHL